MPIVKGTKEEIDCDAHFMLHSAQLCAYSRGKLCVDFLPSKEVLPSDSIKGSIKKAIKKGYLELGHMSPVAPSTRLTSQYILPHHYVLKEESSTT